MAGGQGQRDAAIALKDTFGKAADDITSKAGDFHDITADSSVDGAHAFQNTDDQISDNLGGMGKQPETVADPESPVEGGGGGQNGNGTTGGTDPVNTQGVGPCGKVGEPVDVVGGQYVTARADVELPGVLPLVLRRAYASGYREGRLLGPGWSSTLDIRVWIDADGIHFAGDDAQILHYPVPTQPGQQVMPAEGARWPLTWDRKTDEIYIVDAGHDWTLRFTTLGETRAGSGRVRPLTSLADRNANRITFLRDGDGVPTEVQHSGGYRVAVETGYGAAGFRIEALRLLDGADAGHGTTLCGYQYDPAGRLVEITDSSGVPFIYEYDDENRITAWIDRTGYRFEYAYDDRGRVAATSGEDGYLSGTFAYDPGKRVTYYTDGLGRRSAHHYDEYGHVTRTVDALGGVRATEYDRYGRVRAVTDELGHATGYTLDEHGDPVRIARPDGAVVEAAYNAMRKPTRVTGPDGGVWQYSYDERGNLTAVTDPAGAVTAYAYDAHGALVRITDALGGISAVEVDRAGLPVSITDACGSVWRMTRDARGRVVSVADPLGAVTTTSFDGEGRPVSRRYPDESTEAWEYDEAGNLVRHTDQAGYHTDYEVGPFKLVTARTDPDGSRYDFAHDTELRLLSVTNPQKLKWSYTYDAAGNLTGERDFNGRELSYAHDAAGRVIRRTNGAGQSIELIRDVLGQVAEQHAGEHQITTFEYTVTGELSRAVGSDAELVVTRDALGRVLGETVNGQTLATAYDVLGRKVTRTTPTGHHSAWRYDQIGQPLVLMSGARQLSFGHDAAGRETHRWIGSETALTSEWDRLGRLAARRLLSADGPAEARTSRLIQERAWTYRLDGVPDSITDSAAGVRRFTLDPLGRVTAVTAANWSEHYAYDGAGNLAHTSDSRTPDSDTAGPRELTGTLLRRAGRTSYEYDGQGRLVTAVRRTLSGQVKRWTYAYDAHDRLTGATNPDGQRWRYRYDALGRRTSKERLDAEGNAVEETRFSWDGPILAEQVHTVAGQPEVTATAWDYEPESWTPLAQDRRKYSPEAPQELIDQQFHAIVTDLVGTPTELVTLDGAIAWRGSVGYWGNELSEAHDVDAPGCPLRFPGQYHDVETGLHYNFQRYYDPLTGRYITADPLGLHPSPNDHSYVRNPSSWLDPLGLEGESRVTITAGKNFKTHFLNHKTLLQNVTGRKYPKLKEHGPAFLDDLSKLVNEGNLHYEGLGTLKAGQPEAKIYRGDGVTLVTTQDDEYWTLLKSGEGLDKGIVMTQPVQPETPGESSAACGG